MIHVTINNSCGLSGRAPHHRATVVNGSSRGAGYEKVHVAIDRRTRLAYVEKCWLDEQKETTVGFLPVPSAGSLSRDHLSADPSRQRPLLPLWDCEKPVRALISSPSAPSPKPAQTQRKGRTVFIQTILAERGLRVIGLPNIRMNATAGYPR